MKTFNRILFILVLVYTCFSVMVLIHSLTNYPVFYPTTGKWALVWDDDFDGTELNPTKWMPIYQSCTYDGYQANISAILRDTVTVKDGCLSLSNRGKIWRNEDGRDINILPIHYSTGSCTSGQVATGDKAAWTYGRFEIRAKIPLGMGLFSYASLYPIDGNFSQEICIMRVFGNNPYTLYLSNHWGTTRPHRYLEEDVSTRSYGPDYSAEFHTFAVEWEPGIIRWFVDDVQLYQTVRNVPEAPFSLNLGTAAGYPSDVNPKFNLNFDTWKQPFIIDWVRIYQRR